VKETTSFYKKHITIALVTNLSR